MHFSLPPLLYPYNALEPFIDARTMEIHHTKHHQAYITNLNNALDKAPEVDRTSLELLLANCHLIQDDALQAAIKNHGGGHANHSLFWQIMMPPSSIMPQGPVGKLASAIDAQYTSFEKMKEQMAANAQSVFGSGWSWLCLAQDEKLCLMKLPNQDSPLMYGYQPLLGIDVWEHAYYLKYQNKRVDYIAAWWNVVNWEFVSRRYEELIGQTW